MNIILKRWAWLTTITAVAIIFITPTPLPRAGQLAKIEGGWFVPHLNTTTDPQSLVGGLQRTHLWGGQAEAVTSTDDRASHWRVAGVTGQARERYVLVQFGDDRIMPLKAGEKFPDGTPITEIRENGVCVTLSGKQRFLPLNGQTIPIVW
ncbi:MAG: hypothetical protein WCL29_00215 [Pseudomonadota bacterium]